MLDVGAQPPPPPAEIDILFVVDNSFSMRHEARNVAQNMLGIWNELEDLSDPEGQPFLDFFDVHMMVTTTDVGGPRLGIIAVRFRVRRFTNPPNFTLQNLGLSANGIRNV